MDRLKVFLSAPAGITRLRGGGTTGPTAAALAAAAQQYIWYYYGIEYYQRCYDIIPYARTCMHDELQALYVDRYVRLLVGQ